MTRTSHALVDSGRVWLIDPVDVPEAIERATALGEVVGVVQLLDRHERDNEALASRFGVPHLRLPAAVDDAPFEVFKVVDIPRWREVGLWWPERKALVIAEVVGTNPLFAVGDGPVGVHPMVRLFPPRVMTRYGPDLLLTGHGPPLEGPGTAAALHAAVDHSRRDIPRLLTKLPQALRG